MACLIRRPTVDSKGVLTVTTQEHIHEIQKKPEIRQRLEVLKSRFFVGLHHNWHNFKYVHDSLFDFNMAGAEDLKLLDGSWHPTLDMDAVSFVPNFFKAVPLEQKFWDVLYVARGVYFKRPFVFMDVIRKLFDRRRDVRVLFICAVNPEPEKRWFWQPKTRFTKADLRSYYDSLFSVEERQRFDFMTLDYAHPYPFALESLAHFYRSAKIFVHSADDERRCRVASYAFAGGLPVVGMECVGSILPPEARKAPTFYEVRNNVQYPDLIEQALQAVRMGNSGEGAQYFLESSTTQLLMERLNKKFGVPIEPTAYFIEDLGIRLGMHHFGNGLKDNFRLGFGEFLQRLERLPDELDRAQPEQAIDRI